MGIDSHGNNVHSHPHTGCFPFLPIPIPNFVTNSHYRGNPIPMVISTTNFQLTTSTMKSDTGGWVRETKLNHTQLALVALVLFRNFRLQSCIVEQTTM